MQRRDGPAPDSYGRPDDPRDKSPVKKGFSFGLRERTKSATSVITNRYRRLPPHIAPAPASPPVAASPKYDRQPSHIPMSGTVSTLGSTADGVSAVGYGILPACLTVGRSRRAGTTARWRRRRACATTRPAPPPTSCPRRWRRARSRPQRASAPQDGTRARSCTSRSECHTPTTLSMRQHWDEVGR